MRVSYWRAVYTEGDGYLSDSVFGTEGDKGKSGGRGRGGKMKAPAKSSLAGVVGWPVRSIRG